MILKRDQISLEKVVRDEVPKRISIEARDEEVTGNFWITCAHNTAAG